MLTEADQKVAWAMIEAIRNEQGLSFCSSMTLAQQTGLHSTTVRASRCKLTDLSYFEVVRKGGTNRSTRFRPNHRLIETVPATGPYSSVPVLQAFSAPPPSNDTHPLQTADRQQQNPQSVASNTTGIPTIGWGGRLKRERKRSSSRCSLGWMIRLRSGGGSGSSAFTSGFPSGCWLRKSASANLISRTWNEVVIGSASGRAAGFANWWQHEPCFRPTSFGGMGTVHVVVARRHRPKCRRRNRNNSDRHL